ncbi:MAG TPA: hypothetical protein VFT22_40150 [Kofleriaceae bacterium]|nr:hypothetical protein [Kofleriaceae bacterium]
MTRAALGIGIGLLLSDRLSISARRAVGWALVASGALVTIPLAMEVLHKGRISREAGSDARSGLGERTRTERSMSSAYTP